jgi:predicted nucleic acid-binding protein
MNLMVDSSAWIGLLREGVDVRARLVPYLRSATLYNCGVIRAELLRGFRSTAARDEICGFLDIVPEVPCDAKLWRTVADLGWALGRLGKWPPVSDLAIAACCLRVDATLVTLDAHFDDVSGLRIAREIP